MTPNDNDASTAVLSAVEGGIAVVRAQATQGIDVSSNQGQIDWAAVAGAGIQFAYLRCTDGVGWEDPMLRRYVVGARSEGLPLGGYHVLRGRAGRPQDAEAQARGFLERHRREQLELLPMLDVEDPASPKGMAPGATAEVIATWLHVIEGELGVRPIVYTYPGFWASHPELRDASFARFPLWIAHYRQGGPTIPKPWATPLLWQYAAGAGVIGSVAGVRGPVDRDVLYGGVDVLRLGAH